VFSTANRKMKHMIFLVFFFLGGRAVATTTAPPTTTTSTPIIQQNSVISFLSNQSCYGVCSLSSLIQQYFGTTPFCQVQYAAGLPNSSVVTGLGSQFRWWSGVSYGSLPTNVAYGTSGSVNQILILGSVKINSFKLGCYSSSVLKITVLDAFDNNVLDTRNVSLSTGATTTVLGPWQSSQFFFFFFFLFVNPNSSIITFPIFLSKLLVLH
jgi:hypothetical protein